MKANEEATDQRKGKTLCWKEARLALAHDVGSTLPPLSFLLSLAVVLRKQDSPY